MNQQQNFGFGAVPPEQPTAGKEKTPPKATFESVSATGVVLDNFRHAKEEYDTSKKRLDECKGLVIQHIGEQISVGTNRFATNHYVLKTSVSKKYEVDAKDKNNLNQALHQIAVIEGGEVAGSLLTWKPSLNTKVYDNLSPQAKEIINNFITMSYSSPTLTVEV